MRKTLILAVGLLMLMSFSSFASETRTLVMGENDMIMVDDYNMFMFPGRINNYPNLALGEFDFNDELYDFGITWQFNDDNPWVLGTFISTEPQIGPHNFYNSDMAMFYNYYTGSAASPEALGEDYPKRIQLQYGRQLGGHNFGFSLGVTRQSWEYDQSEQLADSNHVYIPANHAKQSFSQYEFGLGLTEGTSGQWDIALHFMTGGWTNEDWESKTITEPDGFSDIGLVGRYFMVRNPKVTLVPHVGVTIGSRGVKDYTDDLDSAIYVENRKWSRTAFELGVGMNYTPAPNMLAVFDFGLASEKIKYEQNGGGYSATAQGEETDSYLAFPYFRIGFEGEVLSWLDFRAGATTTLWTSKDKTESDWDPDEMYNTPYSGNDPFDNATYMGFGFHWGRLYLDTYTDPELILRGPNFITGDYDGDDMNWKVSLTYEMF